MKTHDSTSTLYVVFEAAAFGAAKRQRKRFRETMHTIKQRTFTSLVVVLSLGASWPTAYGQTAAAQPTIASTTPQTIAETITLDEAIKRAQTSEPTYASAVADSKVADAQRGIAHAALLPGLVYHNQYLYTQPLHLDGHPVSPNVSTPRFIANNAVHEYTSQASITETIGVAGIADLRRADAEAVAAQARLEIARRGLVSTVVSSYYGVLAAAEKLIVAQRALGEADHFDKITGQLEQGGEVAHADSVKSHLQVQQRKRELSEAEFATEKARLDLAVLLYANPLTPYTVSGDLQHLPGLPLREQINAAANVNNPDLRAAIASFHAASFEATSAHADFLPSLSLNYSYGIDSQQFAVHAPDGTRNLGYSAYATLDIPVWDWFATRDKLRQSNARKDLAAVELTSTQRKLTASLQELYREAEASRSQLTLLEESVRDATEALRLSNLRYSAGEAPVLEVTDAQNTLITIENNRADGAARYYTALADLQTLTGNLP